jgi:hypothetical protein
MRKPIVIIIAMLLLQGCVGLDLFSKPTPVSTHTSSPTVTETPTITLTPTRTITPTPRNTATPISGYPTYTPVILVSAGPPTAAFSPTPIYPTGGFESVTISEKKIFWGICKPRYVNMTAKVQYPEDVHKVYLFFRLESAKKPGDTTPWAGTVTDKGALGYFNYTLWASHIPERKNFIKAWVHFQFVAEDRNQIIIGRSRIYSRELRLEACSKFQP